MNPQAALHQGYSSSELEISAAVPPARFYDFGSDPAILFVTDRSR